MRINNLIYCGAFHPLHIVAFIKLELWAIYTYILSRFTSPKCLLKTAILWRRISGNYKIFHRAPLFNQ